jgi:hypothetical protein
MGMRKSEEKGGGWQRRRSREKRGRGGRGAEKRDVDKESKRRGKEIQV